MSFSSEAHAFPSQPGTDTPGLTTIEYFAAKAMPAIYEAASKGDPDSVISNACKVLDISIYNYDPHVHFVHFVAILAVRQARALINALAREEADRNPPSGSSSAEAAFVRMFGPQDARQ